MFFLKIKHTISENLYLIKIFYKQFIQTINKYIYIKLTNFYIKFN